MRKMMSVNNLVCGIDDNYVQHLGVMLLSLFDNNKNGQFHIYVLSLDLSHERKMLLVKLVEEHGHKIDIINFDKKLIESFPKKESDYISVAAYLRLFIPAILPQNLNKVLYADADIIFNGSVQEIYQLDVSKYALAAIEDAPNNHPLRLGYKEEDSYFNSGFLLLNLDYLRRIDFTNLALEYIKNNPNKMVLHDQDVLNALLHGEVLFLSIKWNMLDCFYFVKPLIKPKHLNELIHYKKQPNVIHFSGPLKPWHIGCYHPYKYMYFHYLAKIHFKDKTVDEWGGLKKFPLYARILILLRLPRMAVEMIQGIVNKIKEKLTFKNNR